MIEFRPCGACRALVPAVSGCGHWHPGQGAPGTRKGKGPASRERKRERDRINAKAARERAKADVAAFREMMERRA